VALLNHELLVGLPLIVSEFLFPLFQEEVTFTNIIGRDENRIGQARLCNALA